LARSRRAGRRGSRPAPRGPWPLGSPARLVRRRRVRPALRADLVDRVEQDQILHVGVLLERRRLERPANTAAGLEDGPAPVGLFRADQALALELVHQPSRRLADLVGGALVPTLERVLDPVEARAAVDRFPD